MDEFELDDDLDDYDDWMDDPENFDCGAMYSIGRNGKPHLEGCGKVGSEECDFECPFREEVERSLRAQYARSNRTA